MCLSNVKRKVTHEKAIRTFALVRPKTCSNEYFQRFILFQRLITAGKSWMHHYMSKTKMENNYKKNKNSYFGWECDGSENVITWRAKGTNFEKRPHLPETKYCFRHGKNLPVTVGTAWPCSLLTRSDVFLFPHLKFFFIKRVEWLLWKFFAPKFAKYYLNELQRWQHHWEKGVEFQGVNAKI